MRSDPGADGMDCRDQLFHVGKRVSGARGAFRRLARSEHGKVRDQLDPARPCLHLGQRRGHEILSWNRHVQAGEIPALGGKEPATSHEPGTVSDPE